MRVKILLYQQELIGKIPENDYQIIKSYKPDFICLPEYFFHPDVVTFDASVSYMSKISLDINCVLIGGSTVSKIEGKMYNTCFIFNRGKEIGFYNKIHLFQPEMGKITPGNEYKLFSIKNVNFSVIICADVLYEDTWNELIKIKPQILFIPTFSPYKEENVKEKFLRDNKIYLEGAKKVGCFIIKTCCTGIFKTTKLQGRSLITGPDNILWRVNPEDEDKPQIKFYELII